MTFDFTTISAFLTGSLATLILREIFNQINKKIDFSRDLIKITYEKKLEKAEKAVAFYWTYTSKVIEVKKSVETIQKALNEVDDTQLDIEIVSSTLGQNAKILDDLSGDKYFDINAVHLYFDLEDEKFWNEEDVGKAYDCIAEMQYRNNDVQFWLAASNAQNGKDEGLEEHYWNEMKKCLPTYLESLQNYIDLLEKNKQATNNMIKKIKKQIKN